MWYFASGAPCHRTAFAGAPHCSHPESTCLAGFRPAKRQCRSHGREGPAQSMNPLADRGPCLLSTDAHFASQPLIRRRRRPLPPITFPPFAIPTSTGPQDPPETFLSSPIIHHPDLNRSADPSIIALSLPRTCVEKRRPTKDPLRRTSPHAPVPLLSQRPSHPKRAEA